MLMFFLIFNASDTGICRQGVHLTPMLSRICVEELQRSFMNVKVFCYGNAKCIRSQPRTKLNAIVHKLYIIVWLIILTVNLCVNDIYKC